MEAFAHSLEQGWEAEIQLVVDAAFPTDLLMRVLRDFRPISRGTRVQLTQVVMSGGTDAIEAGWADLVISGFVPPGYLGELLLNIEFIAVAHPDHHLHHLGREIEKSDLESELQVVISDSGIKQKRVPAGWQQISAGLSPALIMPLRPFGRGWVFAGCRSIVLKVRLQAAA